MPSHAFFPGLAWLATPVRWLTGSDAVTVHVTATVTAVAAFIARLGRHQGLDRRAHRPSGRGAVRPLPVVAVPVGLLLRGAVHRPRRRCGVGRPAGQALDRRALLRRHRHHPLGRHPRAGGHRAGPDHPPAPRRPVGGGLRPVRRSPASARCCSTMHVQVGNAFAFLGVQEDWGRERLVAVGVGGAGHRQPHAQVRHGDGARARGPQPRPVGRGHRGDRHRLPRRVAAAAVPDGGVDARAWP